MKTFFILLGGVLVVILIGYLLLGLSVDFAVDHLPEDAEALIASQLGSTELLSGQIEDERTATMQALLTELQQCAGVDYPLNLTLAESDQVNAFAMPGGQIMMFTGLVDQLESENGLAFVLAHEISHFQNRDHLRTLGRGVVLMALASLITGADSVITKLIMPAISLGETGFSQQRELAADHRALEILNCRYGHVGGATEFFSSQLVNPEQAASSVWGHYFSSHPQAVARIERLQQQGHKAGYSVGHVVRLAVR